jgi:hypothetical protein
MSLPSHRTARIVFFFSCIFLASFFATAFIHTDDGCAFEKHCSSCIFALHHAAGAETLEVTLPESRRAEIAISLPAESLSGEERIEASRGPPRA